MELCCENDDVSYDVRYSYNTLRRFLNKNRIPNIKTIRKQVLDKLLDKLLDMLLDKLMLKKLKHKLGVHDIQIYNNKLKNKDKAVPAETLGKRKRAKTAE